jgi:hypothetical protein
VLTLDDDTSITFDNYTSAEAFEEASYGIELIDAPAPADYSRVIQGDRELERFHSPGQLSDYSIPFVTAQWTEVDNGTRIKHAIQYENSVGGQSDEWIGPFVSESNTILVRTDSEWSEDQEGPFLSVVETYRIASATWEYNLKDELGNLIRTGMVEAGRDYLYGSEGNDRIAGNGGDDVLYGDEGNDEINGDDRVTPAQYHGDDYLDGGEGADTLVGASGNDAHFSGAMARCEYPNKSQSPQHGEPRQQRTGTRCWAIEAKGGTPVGKPPRICKLPIAANDFFGRVAG